MVVEPGWECEVTERNDLLLTDRIGLPRKTEVSSEVDAITLELFNNRFAAIAEQMGVTLEKNGVVHQYQGAVGLQLRRLRSPR